MQLSAFDWTPELPPLIKSEPGSTEVSTPAPLPKKDTRTVENNDTGNPSQKIELKSEQTLEQGSQHVDQPTNTPTYEPTVSISGKSISELLNGNLSGRNHIAENDNKTTSTEDKLIDPLSENKIREATIRFNRELMAERPRIAMAFDGMQVKGHTVSIEVPSHVLQEEILRNKTEILTLLARVSSVNGYIELDIKLVETAQGVRPIKIADKLKYLTDKNPLLTKFRRKMELDIE